MLRVFFDSAPDGVDKSLRFAQALTKKSLESLPAYKNVNLGLYPTLVLLSTEQGGIFQESGRKQNSVHAHGIGNSKVIFALLEEIVTLQMRFTSINVCKLSF